MQSHICYCMVHMNGSLERECETLLPELSSVRTFCARAFNISVYSGEKLSGTITIVCVASALSSASLRTMFVVGSGCGGGGGRRGRPWRPRR